MKQKNAVLVEELQQREGMKAEDKVSDGDTIKDTDNKPGTGTKSGGKLLEHSKQDVLDMRTSDLKMIDNLNEKVVQLKGQLEEQQVWNKENNSKLSNLREENNKLQQVSVEPFQALLCITVVYY